MITMQSLILLIVYLVVLLALAWPMGAYLAMVGDGSSIRGLGWLRRVEDSLYRIAGTSREAPMTWKTYAIALLVFNALGVLFVYAVQRLQLWLPLNPQAMVNVSPDSAFNTAVSFVSNTNWQGYTLSLIHI